MSIKHGEQANVHRNPVGVAIAQAFPTGNPHPGQAITLLVDYLDSKEWEGGDENLEWMLDVRVKLQLSTNAGRISQVQVLVPGLANQMDNEWAVVHVSPRGRVGIWLASDETSRLSLPDGVDHDRAAADALEASLEAAAAPAPAVQP
jgi:hypothetical protein